MYSSLKSPPPYSSLSILQPSMLNHKAKPFTTTLSPEILRSWTVKESRPNHPTYTNYTLDNIQNIYFLLIEERKKTEISLMSISISNQQLLSQNITLLETMRRLEEVVQKQQHKIDSLVERMSQT